MLTNIKNFFRQTHASVLVEFALIVPVLVLLFTGLYDIASLAYTQTRVARLAALYANTISLNTFSRPSITAYLSNANNVSFPLKFSNNGGCIIVSDVSNLGQTSNAATMLINWQVQQGSGSSQIGIAGVKPSTLPGNLQLVLNEEAIIVEVFYTYKPLLPVSFMSSSYNIYRAVVFPIRGKSQAILSLI